MLENCSQSLNKSQTESMKNYFVFFDRYSTQKTTTIFKKVVTSEEK